jgi:hypothetical protein
MAWGQSEAALYAKNRARGNRRAQWRKARNTEAYDTLGCVGLQIGRNTHAPNQRFAG